MLAFTRLVGLVVRDLVLTRGGVNSLKAGFLISGNAAVGITKLSD